MSPVLPPKDQLLRELAPHREKWTLTAKPTPESSGEGEESVWDYPRPPELRPAKARAKVVFADKTVADSSAALRIVETAGAPVYYFSPDDVMVTALEKTRDVSLCEWKGAAVHYDLVVEGRRAENAAFSYPDPLDDLGRGFSKISGWFGFYPARVDGCYLGEEKVRPQPGGVYAGWVTADIRGPVKGAPGTEHW